MPLGEFELIRRYFTSAGAARADVILGVGDDGAVLEPPQGQQLVVVADTLVEGTHFLPGSPPESIGHRALAVNLSDIAAMGATPAWALLALTLPHADEGWLEAFARGFGRLAQRHGVALVGGDTTSGSLSITVQVIGFAPAGTALRRDRAQPGDLLCVTGTPGDAAAGLAIERVAGRDTTASSTAAARHLRERFLFPEPRLASGLLLRKFATACIDVSDGLLGDAGKLCSASGCGAVLQADQLPISAPLRAWAAPRGRSSSHSPAATTTSCASPCRQCVAPHSRPPGPRRMRMPVSWIRASRSSVNCGASLASKSATWKP